ncbi:MAG: sugar phosphate isomerase/epimerase family protein [Novosphingobium sp.]
MDRLSIEFINTMGMNPVDQVRLVASLGLRQVSMGLSPVTDNPHGYAPWTLVDNPALVKETRRALDETGLSVALGEGFLIMPGVDVSTSVAGLDAMAELGAPRVNCLIIMEEDRARACDQFARLAGMAAERGMDLTLEFMPLMWPATLEEAQGVIVEAGAANGRLLVDSMHYYRSGATTADLARIDPALIGYIQICDVPMPAASPDYGEEARHNRLCPGEGDLPLEDFLRALPRDLIVGIEAPMLAKARAGVAPADAIRPCVEATRSLLAALD